MLQDSSSCDKYQTAHECSSATQKLLSALTLIQIIQKLLIIRSERAKQLIHVPCTNS